MEIFDSFGHIFESLLSDSAVLGVIVGDLYFRLEELVVDELA